MSKSVFGLDKPVTKGDLWQVVAGVKIFEAKEKQREKIEARIQIEHDEMKKHINDLFSKEAEDAQEEQERIEAEERQQERDLKLGKDDKSKSKKPLSEKERRKMLFKQYMENQEN